jgi:hypothetical protein
MPYGDETGPEGMGPRTGRGMGYCNGFDTPGFINSGFRRGFGRRLGIGRGLRGIFGSVQQPAYAPVRMTKDDEKKLLREERKALEQELREVEKRIKELK